MVQSCNCAHCTNLSVAPFSIEKIQRPHRIFRCWLVCLFFLLWPCCRWPGVLLQCHMHYYLFLMHFIFFSPLYLYLLTHSHTRLSYLFISRVRARAFFFVWVRSWLAMVGPIPLDVFLCFSSLPFFFQLLHIIGLFSFWFRLNDFNARWRHVWFTVFAIDAKCNGNNQEPMKYFKWEYTHLKEKRKKVHRNKVKKDSNERAKKPKNQHTPRTNTNK